MEDLKLSRKEREYLRHRQEILQVALKLFSERGFHNVSMHEIAQKSEFAVGTLYKFFSKKEDLYLALILEKAREFRSALTAALQTPGDEMKKIRTWLEAKIRLFMDSLDFVRLYVAETRGGSFNIKAGLDKEIKKNYEMTLKEIEALFASGIKKKLFAKFDPHLLAVALEGISNAFLFEHLEHPDKHWLDANLILEIFFQQVYTGGAHG
ncbi:MAG: TetR/AcrR family transcriptional regulator [Desulfobacterales bacterium]|nr:TetR/AcrR family transcriptional regulator [Desulfobacterales bacterium]